MNPLLKPLAYVALAIGLAQSTGWAEGSFYQLAETASPELQQTAAAKVASAELLYQAKQVWRDLRRFEQLTQLYADWVKCGSEGAQRSRVKPTSITVAALNQLNYDEQRAVMDTYQYGAQVAAFVPLDEWSLEARNVSRDQRRAFAELDPLGNPYGPFTIGQPPQVNPATQAALAPVLSGLPFSFWGEYANSAAAGATAPSNDQITKANEVLTTLAAIEQATQQYVERQTFELQQHQRRLKGARAAVQHTSEDLLAGHQQQARKEQQIVDDLEARLSGQCPLAFTDLGVCGPLDAFGNPFEPIRVGVKPRVPQATFDLLKGVLPGDFWNGYTRSPAAATP